MLQKKAVRRGWYIGDYSRLAWSEVIVKLIGHALAALALLYALVGGVYIIPDDLTFLAVLILGILALGLTAMLVERFIQREGIALVFGIINAAAHWSMLFALLTFPGPGSLLPMFALLMLVGDLLRLRFYSVTNFIAHTYPSVPIWLPYVLVGIYIVGYTLIIMMSLGSPWVYPRPA